MAKKPYKTMKKTAKAQGRETRKTTRQAGKTIKRGTRAVASGEKQMGAAMKQQSKGVSSGGTPKRKPRVKAQNASVKISSGKSAAANPTPRKKIKKKAYTTVPNINASAPGQKKYLTKKGKQTNRRGGRPKA